jgi:rubrerythrin
MTLVADRREDRPAPAAGAVRSASFDRYILAADEHVWHPLNKDDIDFDQPFDMAGRAILDEDMVVGLRTPYVSDHLAATGQRARFINEAALRCFSTILHGERAALKFAAHLCQVSDDPGVQEIAANQAREEARHVTAFDLYIRSRWGQSAAAIPVLETFTQEAMASPQVWKKVIGMQILVESLAMGIFSALSHRVHDPVGRKLLRLVTIDESFHVRSGKVWVDEVVASASPSELARMQAWTARRFRLLALGLFSASGQLDLYHRFGLDAARVTADVRAGLDRSDRQSPAEAVLGAMSRAIRRVGLAGPGSDRLYGPYLTASSDLQFEGFLD